MSVSRSDAGKPIVAVCLLVWCAFGAVSSASACSCNDFDVERVFSQAGYVFKGHIRQAEENRLADSSVGYWKSQPGQYFIKADFSVVESWKGDASELSGLITHPDSHSCGTVLAPGQEYIFFISRSWRQPRLFGEREYGVATLCGTLENYAPDTYINTRSWLKQHSAGDSDD